MTLATSEAPLLPSLQTRGLNSTRESSPGIPTPKEASTSTLVRLGRARSNNNSRVVPLLMSGTSETKVETKEADRLTTTGATTTNEASRPERRPFIQTLR